MHVARYNFILILQHLFSIGIIQQAADLSVCESMCSFCSRMRRGRLYACARREGYNVLAMGEHLDDFAETLAFVCHDGQVSVVFSLVFHGQNEPSIGWLS